MVATFINEAKWKEQQARPAKVAKAKKEKFLRQNLLKLTPDALVSTQAELQVLTDKYDKLSDRESIKSNFIKLATSVVDDYNKRTAPRAPTPQPLVEQPADASPDEDETPQAEEEHQERRVDEPAIEEIITETATDEIAATDENAPDPAASSNQADNSVPAGSSLPAEESEERTPSPKASKVKKIIPSASDEKKTRAAEKEAKKRKASSAVEETKAKRLKESEETAPLDPVPLNVAPSYEMVIIDDPAKKADEEMKDVAPEEHTDEEIQIDDSPQPLIPQTRTAQASAAPADEAASTTKPAEEKQAENPHANEIVHSEKTPQDEEQADPTPPNEKEAEIPQPEAQREQASSPENEVPADEIPHPEENAEENVPAQDNDFIVLNPETAIVVSSPIPQQNLHRFSQPFSKRPKFEKKISLKNAYISDWNSKLILQFYATLHISGNPEDINTWVFDWMTQNTHYKAPASELLRELPVPIPSDAAVKLYGERELPNGMMEVLMKPLAAGKSSRTTFLVHELKYTPRTRTGINFHAVCQNHVGYMPPIRVNKKTFEPIEGKGKFVIEEGGRPLDGQFTDPEAYSSWDDTETRPASPVPPRVLNTRELLLSLHQKVDRNRKWVKRKFGAIVKTLTETQNSVKLNHHYLHEVFDRTWATLAHLKTQTELEEMYFERDFDWSWPPKRKFRPILVPDLEDISFSSFRTAESDEEQLDTATGPRKKTTPKKHRGSSSTAKK
ncbi:hypothetical protein ZWY2020_003830 [Hordeum vulgare]|nr:hypothetical protein ZWY2020_003830 [Hordeum vulgare]